MGTRRFSSSVKNANGKQEEVSTDGTDSTDIHHSNPLNPSRRTPVWAFNPLTIPALDGFSSSAVPFLLLKSASHARTPRRGRLPARLGNIKGKRKLYVGTGLVLQDESLSEP